MLAAGIAVHLVALGDFVRIHGEPPLTGLGPAMSFAAVLVAITLLTVEALAREVSLTLFAAPLAALLTGFASLTGMVPGPEADGMRGVWLTSHIALSFLGIAAFATAAGAGVMYLVERRELKSRRFGAIFRFFPPLETLDRVNHVAVVAGWLALTSVSGSRSSYALEYRTGHAIKMVWAYSAWLAVTALTIGRVVRGWCAHRAAMLTEPAVRGRGGVVHRVPRDRPAQGAVPVSAYPIMLDGARVDAADRGRRQRSRAEGDGVVGGGGTRAHHRPVAERAGTGAGRRALHDRDATLHGVRPFA